MKKGDLSTALYLCCVQNNFFASVCLLTNKRSVGIIVIGNSPATEAQTILVCFFTQYVLDQRFKIGKCRLIRRILICVQDFFSLGDALRNILFCQGTKSICVSNVIQHIQFFQIGLRNACCFACCI